jgi:hypothetical protein
MSGMTGRARQGRTPGASGLVLDFDARRPAAQMLNESSHIGVLACTRGYFCVRLGTVKIRLRLFDGPLVCPGGRVDEFTKSTSART